MSAWTWWEAALPRANDRRYVLMFWWRLLSPVLRCLRLGVVVAVLAWLTAATAELAPLTPGPQHTTAPAVVEKLADHEARLNENDRTHARIESMHISERLASLEASVESSHDLLLAIAAAIGLILLKEVVALIQAQKRR